jgi:hypothetical protein
MADDDKVVRADFTRKRRPPGAKQKPALLQSKRFGICVLVLIVAFGFAAHLFLIAP